MASSGMVMGFTTGLLTQLKEDGSAIPIDDETGSWIAASPGFTLLLGNAVVPILMSKFGRKTTNLITIVLQIAGWLSIAGADNLTVLLVARSIQGLSLGAVMVFGPILIGEYSSPQYRGIFLMNISIITSLTVLIVHTSGLYLHWKITALIFAVIMFVNLLIVIFSPMSPSWLASQGRIEETARNFRWLRGEDEEKELQKMITYSMKVQTKSASEHLLTRIKKALLYFKIIVKKKEFYKPVIIMVHLYTLGQWAGINIMSVFTVDIFKYIVRQCDSPIYVIALDIQRVISTAIALIIIKKTRRRLVLFVTTGINIAILILTAGYTFAKSKNQSLEYSLLGLVLIHLHMFSIACGTLPMPLVISGEIFPLECRSLAGGISILFFSFSFTLVVKTFPLLIRTLDVHGTYLIYAGVTAYSLAVAAVFLPETKDKSLQDIEDEFKGIPVDMTTAERLISNSDNNVNVKLLDDSANNLIKRN
ncbi:facilitated trehalose transporter Tret1-like isoform X2 [Plodia interpunctella]